MAEQVKTQREIESEADKAKLSTDVFIEITKGAEFEERDYFTAPSATKSFSDQPVEGDYFGTPSPEPSVSEIEEESSGATVATPLIDTDVERVDVSAEPIKIPEYVDDTIPEYIDDMEFIGELHDEMETIGADTFIPLKVPDMPPSDFMEGLRSSSTVKMFTGEIPDPKEREFWDQVQFGLGNIVGEFPIFYVGGVFAGASKILQMGGAFGLDKALNKLVNDHIQKGEIINSRNFWEIMDTPEFYVRLEDAMKEFGKGELVGGLTAGAGAGVGMVGTKLGLPQIRMGVGALGKSKAGLGVGHFANEMAKFTAEVPTMVAAESLLEGVPITREDLALTAMTLFILKMAALPLANETRPWVKQKALSFEETTRRLVEIYNKYKIHPRNVTLNDLYDNGARLERASEQGFVEGQFYHGSRADIKEFQYDTQGLTTDAASAKKGFFFTTSSKVATGYALGVLGKSRDYMQLGQKLKKLESERGNNLKYLRTINESLKILNREIKPDKYQKKKQDLIKGLKEKPNEKDIKEIEKRLAEEHFPSIKDEMVKSGFIKIGTAFETIPADTASGMKIVKDASGEPKLKDVYILEFNKLRETVKTEYNEKELDIQDEMDRSLEEEHKERTDVARRVGSGKDALIKYVKEIGGLDPERSHFYELEEIYKDGLKKAEELGASYEEKVTKLYSEMKAAEIELEAVDSRGASVYPVRLKFEDPMYHDYGGERYREESYSDLIDEALDNGHDALILRDTFDPGSHKFDEMTDVVIVFEPEQIRSAYDSFKEENRDSPLLIHEDPSVTEFPEQLNALENFVRQFAEMGEEGMVKLPDWSKRLTDELIERGRIPDWLRKRRDVDKETIGEAKKLVEEKEKPVEAEPTLETIVEPLKKSQEKYRHRIADKISDFFDPIGKLPYKEEYLIERYKTFGKLARIDDVVASVGKAFKGLKKKDREAVYEYMTTKDASLDLISDKAQEKYGTRDTAKEAKDLIDKIGQKLVERKMMSKETYEKHRGEYLPRVYLKHLLGEEGIGMGGGKLGVSDQGYLKPRKDIPEEVRKILMGEITDPAFLTGRAIGFPERDMVLHDFLETISEKGKTRGWILEDSVVDYMPSNEFIREMQKGEGTQFFKFPKKPKKVSAIWLQEEAKRLKEQAAYMEEGELRNRALRYAEDMEEQAKPGLNLTPSKDFKQIPNTSKYGALKGVWVRKEIHSDLTGTIGMMPKDPAVMQQILGDGGAVVKWTQAWKLSKVALNPPTQIRNLVSNGVMLNLSGVSMVKLPLRMIEAASSIAANGKYWKIAKKYGVTKSTFSSEELLSLKTDMMKIEAKGIHPMAKMKLMVSRIANFAGDVYGKSESIFKVAKIIDSMKKGMSEGEAVLEANKWLFDYSLVHPSIRYLRNAPLGAPFATFYYKAFPIMIETAIKHPQRFLPYVAIPFVLQQMIANEYNVTREDLDHLKQALPDYMRKKAEVYIMPYKDKHGRWEIFDYSYFVPWGFITSMAKNLGEGLSNPSLEKFKDVFMVTGLLGTPVVAAINAITVNKDSFTKRPIYNEADPFSVQLADMMGYIWRSQAPTWMTDIGAAAHTYRALFGKVNPKTGEPLLTMRQALWRWAGVNLYPINPEMSRMKNIKKMQREIQDAQNNMKWEMFDMNLTKDEMQAIMNEYMAHIKERQKSLQEYIEISEIHPNLMREESRKPFTMKDLQKMFEAEGIKMNEQQLENLVNTKEFDDFLREKLNSNLTGVGK